MADDNEFLLLAVCALVICLSAWYIGYLCWQMYDSARWEAQSRKEDREAQQAKKVARIQERHDYQEVLDEFGLTETDIEDEPELVKERIQQYIAQQRSTYFPRRGDQ